MARKTSKKKPGKTKARAFQVAQPLPVDRALLTAGVELDPEIEVERQRRMEGIKAQLLQMIAAGNTETAIDSVMGALVTMERENDRLAWRVLKATRYRFGRSTEKLSREELKQLYLAFDGDAEKAETQAELPVPAPEEPEQVTDGSQASGPETSAPASTPKKRQNRIQAMKVAAHVERTTETITVPEEERKCSLCGAEMKCFGYAEHETFTFVPARVVVHVEQREKLGCSCRGDAVTAPRSSTPNVVRKVDASLLAKLLTDKCCQGLPLDRQRRELGRLGLEVPDKTLQSYWSYTTDLIEPVALAVLSGVFASPIVGADDTHLKTLDKSAKHGVFRGHIWCFVGTEGIVGGPETVAYGYTPTWEATEISEWFSSIEGFIQVDGYAGYSREVDDDDGETRVAVPDDRRLGCGMHIRSKFHAALLAKDRRAAIPLKHFADLYAVEEDGKSQNLDAEARHLERQRRSLPILDAFDEWVDLTHPKLLPKSPLRIATTYAINQRDYFRRCFSDGRFEIDNGRTERRIRPFAVARRNFLFTGSVRGGERLAAAFTLVDNCLLLGIDPYRYLVDVITKLEASWPLRRLSELTPANWLAQQTAQ